MLSADTKLVDGWFTEKVTPHDTYSHQIKKIILKTRTQFQDVIFAETYSFGRCLILDGEIQSAQFDEFIYHECLVHPAMVLHPKPRKILVLGGGEGATVREILRHPGVQNVTMVDIDGEVIDFCKRYLADWHQGALEDPRTRLHIEDAHRYILETEDKFDVIISDLPTPGDGSPMLRLYSGEFYRQIATKLTPGGILVIQAGSGSLLQARFHALLHSTLKRVFKVVRPYYAFVPSFDVPWSFVVAARAGDPRLIPAARVDRRLGTFRSDLRFYDGEAHEGLFRVPKYLRSLLAVERRILTEKEPLTL